MIEKISASAAILSLTEIGLGSMLHSFKIPFSGHFLSLNQTLILGKISVTLKGVPRSRFCSSQISLISSLLKSLSPSGKKLTPMLAISAQGFLFNMGTLLFGVNPIGVWVGAVLLALWGFVQPIGIYMLLFGENLLYMGKYFLKKFSVLSSISIEQVWTVLVIIIGIKITLSTIVVFLIFTIEKEKYLQWQQKLIKQSQRKRDNLHEQLQEQTFLTSVKKAIKDLFNPLFITTWVFTAIFFYFSKSEHSNLIWILCRPLIIGFLLFLSIRVLPFDTLFRCLEKLGFSNFSKILQSSIDKLKNL